MRSAPNCSNRLALINVSRHDRDSKHFGSLHTHAACAAHAEEDPNRAFGEMSFLIV